MSSYGKAVYFGGIKYDMLGQWPEIEKGHVFGYFGLKRGNRLWITCPIADKNVSEIAQAL